MYRSWGLVPAQLWKWVLARLMCDLLPNLFERAKRREHRRRLVVASRCAGVGMDLRLGSWLGLELELLLVLGLDSKLGLQVKLEV